MDRDEIVRFLDGFLEVSRIDDAAENGLQVQGRPTVERVVLGVSASLELFRKAVRRRADMVVVHHGLLWKGQPARIVGPLYSRIRELLTNDLSLVAYHLPLDMHPEVGNNAEIARRLGLTDPEPFGTYRGRPIGFAGRLERSVPFARFVEDVRKLFRSDPIVVSHGKKLVSRIGVVSGGAPMGVSEAIARGMDVYLTGTIDEYVPSLCREGGIHFVAAGHYNTERFGVIALGRVLARRFGLPAKFVDVPNAY